MGFPKVSLPKIALLFLISLNALFSVSRSEEVKPSTAIPGTGPMDRTAFPKGFIFGAGTAAYQTEGAAFTDGKGKTIWDIFTRNQSGKIWDGSNGDVANDFYHRYREDIHLMQKIGLDSFRFSISWARVLPKGKVSGGVNKLGVKFYNDLIDALLAHGIKPFITLFHYDTPQALEEEYKSWLSPNIVQDFADYADFCFKTFGDRVKHWVTLNEPNGFSMNGYNYGTFAPGRCSNYVGNCSEGNSATEPYISAHHFLLAHATAVKVYRTKYKPYQHGVIGITIVTHWFVPKFNTPASIKAASRALDFFFGWYAHPVTFGHYPKTMRLAIGDRLPKFTPEQTILMKGSMDFLGLNYYTTNYANPAMLKSTLNKSLDIDRSVDLTPIKNGKPIGTPTALNWLYIYPKGLLLLLNHLKENYNNPEIYITENGLADNSSISMAEAINDSLRIHYHDSHLRYLLLAMKNGVKVKAYYVWTFWDDFEWDAGFTVRFGITYIDYTKNLARHLKRSAYWFQKFLLRH